MTTELPRAVGAPLDAPVRHRCAPEWAGDKPFYDGYGVAVFDCEENERGEFWVSNGEYDTRVNFCPFCGQKATVPVELRQASCAASGVCV